MNSILQIRFREIMRLVQYHAIGGGGCVVLRSFKKTCCKKAGWWTFSRCLILKSSAASIPETIISQGCSWPMKGNNSGTRDGPFHPEKNSSDSTDNLLWGSYCLDEHFSGLHWSLRLFLLKTPSFWFPLNRHQTCIILWKPFPPNLFSSSFILCSYFPQINLSNV